MRTAKAMTGLMLAATLVAGCSSTGDVKGGADGAGKGASDAFGRQDPAKAPVKLSVPPQYDGAKGWDETLGWVPDSVATLPFTDVPRSDLVAMLHGSSDGYTVQAKAGPGGKVGWSSVPWKVPTPIGGAEGNASAAKDVEIPDLMGFEQDGHGYVVAWAHGMSGKDALHEGTEVVRLAVFASDASGAGVKPLREVDVPVSASPNEVRVGAHGGRLLVAWGDTGPYPRSAAAVDVTTGTVTPYKDPNKLLPQCAQSSLCQSSRVVAVSADGPLVSMGLGRGFGVPGRWFSDTVRPDGVQAKSGILDDWNGRAYGVAAGRLLASWNVGGKYDSDGPSTWSVHDVRTGALLARMECAYNETPDILSQSPDHQTAASPSGRYLAAGPVAFDLEKKRGICLAGDGNRKTIALVSVRDDGTAYGAVEEEVGSGADPAVAQVDLNSATGDAKVLGTDVNVPALTDVGGSGLFVTRDDSKRILVSLRQGR